MKLFSCLAALFLFFTTASSGQSTLLEGRVLEESSNTPLIGAVVSAVGLPDSTLLQQTATGESGKFGLLVGREQRILIRITYVGYETVVSSVVEVGKGNLLQVGDFRMKEDAVLLGAISVSGKKPSITQDVDRMTVDVGGSVLTEGNNVLELLERTPGITMQGDGNFAVNGRTGARVTLDGRTTYLSGPQLALLLKGMQARDITKVEIMSSPSARQDAEGSGGVINIITKKNRRAAGWGGDVFARGAHGRRPQYAAGGGLTYKTETLNVFLNGSHGYDESRADAYNERVFEGEGGAGLTTRQWEKNRTDPGRNYSLRGGFEYTPDTVNTLGFSINWIKGRYESFSDAELGFYNRQDQLLRKTLTDNNFDEGYNNLTYTLYYTRRFKGEGHELRVTADYAPHGNEYQNGFYTRFFNTDGSISAGPSARTNVQDLTNTTYVGGLDYIRPLKGGAKLELGWKATYLYIDNGVVNDTLRSDTWVQDDGTTNTFRYGQHLQAGYLIYSTKIQKLSVQAGLRGEYTGTLANQVTLNSKIRRHYFDLFPNLFLNYPLSQKQNARLSYSRRIARPGDHDVNVFRSYEDPFNYWEGNPYLSPSKTHVLEAGHSYDNRFFTTFSYNLGSDVITRIGRVGERLGETLSKPENIGRFVNYGVSVMYNASLNSWWEMSNYLNVFHNQYKGQFGSTVLDNSANSWSVNSRHTARLAGDLVLEGLGYYQSGTASGVSMTAPGYGVDVSINKSFLEKKLTVKLAGTGIVRNGRPESSAFYGNLRSYSYARPDNRKVMLSLNYRFN